MGEYLFIGSAVLSLANGTVLLCVNPQRNVNRAFFIASLWIFFWALGIAMAIREGQEHQAQISFTLIFWIRFSTAAVAFVGWSAWLMRIAILSDRESFSRVLGRSWVFFFIASLAAIIAFSESYIPSSSTPAAKQRGIGYAIYTSIAAGSCLWMLGDALRQMRRLAGIRKVEMQFFLLSIVCACLLLIGSNLASALKNLQWLKQISPLWFLSLHGIAVWAVCYHKVFDAKQVIFSVGQRLALFSLLAVGAVGFSLLLNRLMPLPWSIFLATAISCAIAAALDKPSRRLVGLDPDLILQEPRRTIIQWARQHADENQLRTSFEKLLCDWSQTDRVVLIPFHDKTNFPSGIEPPDNWPDLIALAKDGWLTPESLQRKRSVAGTTSSLAFMARNNLGALLAVPRGDPHPSLLIALGQKESLRPYTFPDIQILLALAELMDNILTHSRAAANAAQLQRVETASMMSRGLAHDLSNLATPVSSFLVHMESRVSAGTPEAVVLSDAKHSIEVMQRYIKESLFFARDMVPRIEPIDAHSLLLSVTRICQERARQANIEIVTQSYPGLIFSADPALMQRLLQNLVFNAIDATHRDGRIELVASVADDGQILFKVCDHGTGIAPEIVDRIFEPYFTTKEGGSTLRGLGLGLAICRKITDLHGGSLAVVSQLKQGTTFTVSLPAKPVNPVALSVLQAKEQTRDPATFGQAPAFI